jgi:hypothetical protein
MFIEEANKKKRDSLLYRAGTDGWGWEIKFH